MDPRKYFCSVRTEIAHAPAASYRRAMREGSKSRQITPLEGDAFLISAITAGDFLRSAAERESGVLPYNGRSLSTSAGMRVFLFAISPRVWSSMAFRIFMGGSYTPRAD